MSEVGAAPGRWKLLETAPAAAPEAERVEVECPPGTFISPGARFDGTLRVRGDFRIDCEFRGRLETDGTVTVDKAGSVEGDIDAREVEIRGAVAGNVRARRLLVLCDGARLHGDVVTACFEIQRHAFFQGTTTMTRPQASSRGTSAQAPPSLPSPS